VRLRIVDGHSAIDALTGYRRKSSADDLAAAVATLAQDPGKRGAMGTVVRGDRPAAREVALAVPARDGAGEEEQDLPKQCPARLDRLRGFVREVRKGSEIRCGFEIGEESNSIDRRPRC
jgi:hypothetical protein